MQVSDNVDLSRLPEHRRSRMEKFKQAFRRLAGPQGGQRTARVAGGFVHCSCGDTVWRRGPLGHGHVRAIQGRAAAVPARGSARPYPSHDTFSQVFRRWTAGVRWPHSAGSWQADRPRPTDRISRGVVAVDGKALRWCLLTRGRQSTPHAPSSSSLRSRRLRMCLAQRKAARARANAQAAGVSLEVLRLLDLLYRHRGCTALPVATLALRRCSSGVRITCWRSRRSAEQVVRCGRSAAHRRAAAAPQPLPNRRKPASSRSLRVATRDRPARYHFRRGPEVRPDVVALGARIILAPPISARCLCGACPKLRSLPALQHHILRQATATHRPRSNRGIENHLAFADTRPNRRLQILGRSRNRTAARQEQRASSNLGVSCPKGLALNLRHAVLTQREPASGVRQ